MGKFLTELNDTFVDFIGRQKMFFVATAPDSGRVNLSPKGLDTLRVMDTTTVAYLDLTGSGIETAAHLRENGRVTMMFCSFEGPALILRLYGMGRVIVPRDPDWEAWMQHFEPMPGQRQIIVLSIESIQTSCGFGVPLYDYVGQRDTLTTWAAKKGEDEIRTYWDKNRVSIDGLPSGLLDETPSA